jgi:hypothetical protein
VVKNRTRLPINPSMNVGVLGPAITSIVNWLLKKFDNKL